MRPNGHDGQMPTHLVKRIETLILGKLQLNRISCLLSTEVVIFLLSCRKATLRKPRRFVGPVFELKFLRDYAVLRDEVNYTALPEIPSFPPFYYTNDFFAQRALTSNE